MNKIREKLGLPRKWRNITDVPKHLRVEDITGDVWDYHSIEGSWRVKFFGVYLYAEDYPGLYRVKGFKEVK